MRVRADTPGGYPGVSKDRHGRAARRNHYYIKKSNNQTLPASGTALNFLLRKYRLELLGCEPSREVSVLLDCVDQLLILADRGRS